MPVGRRGAARAKWLDRVRQDLLPVPYFHVVQTLPHEPQLDRLVLANRRLPYGLLFRATAEALLELAADPRQFESWLSTLYAQKWVVYAQGPPSGVAGAEAVVKYLARYVSGVAISDRRLVSHANGRVTVRWKNYARGGRSDTTTLAGVEFVRRSLLHVLPRGFVRMRSYGLLSNRHRTRALARCRALLGAATSASPGTPGTAIALQTPEPKSCAASDSILCPSCGRGRLRLLESRPRPSWRQLLARQPTAPLVAARPLDGTWPSLARRRSQLPNQDTS